MNKCLQAFRARVLGRPGNVAVITDINNILYYYRCYVGVYYQITYTVLAYYSFQSPFACTTNFSSPKSFRVYKAGDSITILQARSFW